MRIYRIAPHCPHDPSYLVPKIVTPPKKFPNSTYRELDPRGAFVIHTPTRIYVWSGRFCPPAFIAAALNHAKLLVQYEGASRDIQIVQEGSEPDEFVRLMDPAALDPEQEMINARRASITGEVTMTLNMDSSDNSSPQLTARSQNSG
eukprot:CAMPEP_0175086010 /NCGR_PEP_ID=MMETSP0052_2-20121109/28998_1 /TAXON_ID=51329 ORGANISM="Polytomella parva, Strain SAG 63-3" /NCGR_SAMPLE_ID=MMETSP0052_2 /ASSEMBLY_ACC=CAM_ASM_000194 /LENGTH=146 /DNA_ID=CAMNT_0016358119 /DNA_START=555 /DNA_END=992 /DNA_ORIENTATION=-